MAKNITYPNIDMQRTGRKLKHINLLVKQDAMSIIYDIERYNMATMQRRILLYSNKMYQIVA